MVYLEQVLESLKDRYPNESEFHQTATEILIFMYEAIEVFQAEGVVFLPAKAQSSL